MYSLYTYYCQFIVASCPNTDSQVLYSCIKADLKKQANFLVY
jgi:hypothetical protein